MKTKTRTVLSDGETVSYLLQKKKIKNIYLRVRSDGTVYVTAPTRTPEEFLDTFVSSRVDFIRRVREKTAKEREKNPILHSFHDGDTFFLLGEKKTIFLKEKRTGFDYDGSSLTLFVRDKTDETQIKKQWERFMTEKCGEIFPIVTERMKRKIPDYPWPKIKIRIRVMKSRWGSCMPKKAAVTLNRRLIEAPDTCIEYVVLHELCHFIHPDHSSRFHALMTVLMPDWKIRKKQLNQSVSLAD